MKSVIQGALLATAVAIFCVALVAQEGDGEPVFHDGESSDDKYYHAGVVWACRMFPDPIPNIPEPRVQKILPIDDILTAAKRWIPIGYASSLQDAESRFGAVKATCDETCGSASLQIPTCTTLADVGGVLNDVARNWRAIMMQRMCNDLNTMLIDLRLKKNEKGSIPDPTANGFCTDSNDGTSGHRVLDSWYKEMEQLRDSGDLESDESTYCPTSAEAYAEYSCEMKNDLYDDDPACFEPPGGWSEYYEGLITNIRNSEAAQMCRSEGYPTLRIFGD